MPYLNNKLIGFILGLLLSCSAFAAEPVALNPAHPERYTVVKGDTLWHIAIRYLGDPCRYPELARLSRIRNPDLIHPGDKVKIVRTLE